MKIKPRYEELGEINKDAKSVTEIVSKFTPEFESNKIAGMIAGKRGVAKEAILAEWSLKGDIGKDFGNAIHETLELWIKYQQEPKNEVMKIFSRQFQDLCPKKREFLSEEQIYDGDRLVGTVDLQEMEDGVVDILDLKSYDDLYTNHGYLSPPFEAFKNNNFNKTHIQMLLYKRLVESKGRVVRDLYILQQKGLKVDKIKIPASDTLEELVTSII